MIDNYLRLFRTVRHLKITQVFYQVYYRLKPSKRLDSFLSEVSDLPFNPLKFQIQYSSPQLVKAERSFTFLNLNNQFEKSIDWDYQAHGKLWNYNLQYFNFLQQADLSDQVKQGLLKDIGEWLRDGRLKLEPYPVSLRVMNSIRYFSVAGIQNEQLISQTYCELNYLDQHLEFHIMGNHLLENVFALMMGGYAFDREDWQNKAKKILYRELQEQTLVDGAHFELSPMYHQIILFRVLELIDWYSNVQQLDVAFLDFLREKARLMLSWLNNISFSNGDIPHFSDSTIDIAFTTGQLNQFAKQLGLVPALGLPLGQSGYRKYLFGDYECVVDVGAVGPSYQSGHSHADALSFILYHKHVPLLTEAGTSTYQIGKIRNFERSTRAHNTVEIADHDQSEVWGGFRVGRRANVNILKESETEIRASHDGYLQTLGAIHERHYEFEEGGIKITDFIQCKKKVKAKAYFHFPSDFNINLAENGLVVVDGIGSINLIGAFHYYLETYQVSSGYNKNLSAKVLVIEFFEKLETSIRFA